MPRRRVEVVAVVVVDGVTVVVAVPFPRRRKIIPASTSAIVAKQHNPATAHINPYFQFRFICHLLRTIKNRPVAS